MEFANLAATSKLVEAQLISAIRMGAPARVHADLLRRSTELTTRLETFVPRDQAELGDMVGYFVKRASILQRRGEGQRELDVAIAITNRFRNTPLARRAAGGGGFNPTRPIGETLDPADLVSLLGETSDRVAAVSVNHRFLAASAALASFWGTSRIGLMDLHLADVVGLEQFQSGCKSRLDACFADEGQDYVFALEGARQETRRLRCQMQPIHDRQGRLYCATIRVSDAEQPRSPGHDVATTACL